MRFTNSSLSLTAIALFCCFTTFGVMADNNRSTHTRSKQSTSIEEKAKMVDNYRAPKLDPKSKNAEAFVLDLNRELVEQAKAVALRDYQNKPKHEVVADSGKTVNLYDVINESNYYDVEAERIRKAKQQISVKYLKGEVSPEQASRELFESFFPVTTTMKPSVMPSRQMMLKKGADKAITIPMAVIGTDTYSLEWLKLNIEEIRRLNAVVLVTQIETANDFVALKKFAPDVYFQPSNVDQALRPLGVTFYPVLVTRKGIFQ